MTEVLALVTAVVVLVTAVATWLTRRQVQQTKTQVQEVHVLVNSQMAEMVTRVNQLTEALQQSDTAVPPAPERDHD